MWVKISNELTYSPSEIEALPEIPVGNWLLKFSPDKGFFLEKTPDFKMPSKIYGDSEKIARRYINTFKTKTSNLGVLLTGLKGTGKSVTAKITCAISDMPVILITEAFTGDAFKSFLSNISQPVIVFIDEFEKVYYKTEFQNEFLSILDGVFESKKLFLFTSNMKDKINEYMINRPGRVHYLREYYALEDAIIEEYINDNLINKDNKDSLLEVINILGNMTMDTLTALMFEMNLYNETARHAVKELNLRPDKVSYDVDVYNKDNIKLGSSYLSYHPLSTDLVSINIYCSDITNYKGGAENHDKILAEMLKYYTTKKTVVKKVTSGDEDDDRHEYDEETGEYYSKDSQHEQLAAISELSDLNFSENLHKKQEGLYKRIDFRLNIKEITVKQSKQGLELHDKFGNKFKFTKSKNYSYSF